MINDLFYYFVLNRKVPINRSKYYIVFIFDYDNYTNTNFLITELKVSDLSDYQKVMAKQKYPKSAYQILKTDLDTKIKIEDYLKIEFNNLRTINSYCFSNVVKVSYNMNTIFFGKHLKIIYL